jgi:hypothetical protein
MVGSRTARSRFSQACWASTSRSRSREITRSSGTSVFGSKACRYRAKIRTTTTIIVAAWARWGDVAGHAVTAVRARAGHIPQADGVGLGVDRGGQLAAAPQHLADLR